eukprot:2577736-Pyramimonas_sp.AAC.2
MDGDSELGSQTSGAALLRPNGEGMLRHSFETPAENVSIHALFTRQGDVYERGRGALRWRALAQLAS